MRAECEAVLSAVVAILETPQSAPRRGYLEVQAEAIEKLVCLLARLGGTYRGIGQRLGAWTLTGVTMPPVMPRPGQPVKTRISA